MNNAVLNTSNSRMYLVVPLADRFGEQLPGNSREAPPVPRAATTALDDPFKDIDPDVRLPSWFFESLQRRTVAGEDDTVHLDDDGFGIRVVGADVFGAGLGESEAWFAVIDLADPDGNLEQWIEVARRATKAKWTSEICRHLKLNSLRGDVRSQIVVSLQLLGMPSEDDFRDTTGHLSTRAPFAEQLQKSNESDAAEVGEGRYRVVTRRLAGFVAGDPGGSEFFAERFPKEIENQYLLAVVLANWQLNQLSDILDQANAMWADEPDGPLPTLFRGSRAAQRNFETLKGLRERHARFTASGTLGPVFDSGSQGQFWNALQDAMSVHRRLSEVDQMLQSAAMTVETQASMNLERLLAFFTLVIGVPSLAFTVLGVNIDRLTSDSGLSTAWVIAMLVATFAVGLAAYYVANGGVRRKSRTLQKRKPGSSSPAS